MCVVAELLTTQITIFRDADGSGMQGNSTGNLMHNLLIHVVDDV